MKGRKILNGPFLLDEVISWCKVHHQKFIIFKVDFLESL